MLIRMMEMTASIRLFIMSLNNTFALVSCDDELCGSIPSFSAISLCENPSMTAILNTLRYPEGNLSIISNSSFSSNLESEANELSTSNPSLIAENGTICILRILSKYLKDTFFVMATIHSPNLEASFSFSNE